MCSARVGGRRDHAALLGAQLVRRRGSPPAKRDEASYIVQQLGRAPEVAQGPDSHPAPAGESATAVRGGERVAAGPRAQRMRPRCGRPDCPEQYACGADARPGEGRRLARLSPAVDRRRPGDGTAQPPPRRGRNCHGQYADGHAGGLRRRHARTGSGTARSACRTAEASTQSLPAGPSADGPLRRPAGAEPRAVGPAKRSGRGHVVNGTRSRAGRHSPPLAPRAAGAAGAWTTFAGLTLGIARDDDAGATAAQPAPPGGRRGTSRARLRRV